MNQLRKLTGRDWGFEEGQLRTVASGYVREALEFVAAAWLPATSVPHLLLLERETREAAWVVTGCPRSTPAHAVMAEAGLAPVSKRRTALADRLLAKAGDRLWIDGSVTDVVTNGGAGALIIWPGGEELELRSPGLAGRICSEMDALQSASSHLLEHPAHGDYPIVVCTDS